MNYYIYWNPNNDLPKDTENPLNVTATRNRKYAGLEVKNVLDILYPNMKDFIITDGPASEEVKKKIFEGFQKASRVRETR